MAEHALVKEGEVLSDTLVSKEVLKRALPAHLKVNLTDELVDKINDMNADPIVREAFAENILGYTQVLQTGKYKLASYIEAVRYVSYKVMGDSNVSAYCKTFPDRYDRLIREGATDKVISSYVAAYNKNDLVNRILEQTLIPTHILNSHIHQKAINVLAAMMSDETISPKVRSDSANSLLTHLKIPESNKIQLEVNVKQDKSIDELRTATMELVRQQRLALESGAADAADIAASQVISRKVIND